MGWARCLRGCLKLQGVGFTSHISVVGFVSTGWIFYAAIEAVPLSGVGDTNFGIALWVVLNPF